MSVPATAHPQVSRSLLPGSTTRRVLGVLVTLALVAVLLAQASPLALLRALVSLPLWSMSGAFACYLASVLLRTVRWSVLIRSRRVGILVLFPITCVHNLYNNLLPARAGEFSFVYLVRRYFGISSAEGVAVLLTARVLDFLVICAYFAFLLLFASQGTAVQGPAILAAAAGVAVLLFALLLHLDRFAALALRLLDRLLGLFSLRGGRAGRLLLSKGDQVVEHVALVAGRRSLVLPLLLSFASETCVFGMYAFVLAGLGIHLPFPRVAVGVSLMESSTVLPVYNLAGFGTMELAWSVGFLLMGLSRNSAVLSGFTAHLVIVVFFLLLGGAGWLMLQRMPKGPVPDAEEPTTLPAGVVAAAPSKPNLPSPSRFSHTGRTRRD